MSADEAIYAANDEVRRLQDENAELRELCTLMYIHHNGSCIDCSFKDECERSYNFMCVAPARINDRAHELGIGVEG